MPPFSCSYSSNLPELLVQLNCSIAISAFQAGKVIFLCAKDAETIVQLPRSFAKPMGMALRNEKMALACLDEVIVFANSPQLAPEYPKKKNAYDALFLPRATYYTGQTDIHDLDWGIENQLFAVNTSFSCIVKIDDNFSFTPVWKPPFISRLAGEDRCHLNGMALLNGRPRYVAAFGATDTAQGWRTDPEAGGIVMDALNNEFVARDLPMPHSPRLFGKELFLLLSATGEFVKMDVGSGKCEVVARLNGFVRGLCRRGDYAFIGMSKLRKSSPTFNRLKIAEKELSAGVAVVHLPSGSVVSEIQYHSAVEEIYDVQLIPGYRRPGILNTQKPGYKSGLTTPDDAHWLSSDETGHIEKS